MVLVLAELPEIGTLVATRLGVSCPRITAPKSGPKHTATNSLEAKLERLHAKVLDCA